MVTLYSCVRSFMVVSIHPALKAPVLGPQIGRGGLGRFGFEVAVHALMRSVVLWTGGTGELHRDSLLDPPDAQTGEPPQSIGRKRNPMIDPDNLGKPVDSGHALEAQPGGAELLVGHGTAADHEVAVQILHRQGITTHAVSQKKPALEVDSPDMVGKRGFGQFTALNRVDTGPAAAGLDHTVAFEDRSNRTA
jgi:hypothetical protein